MISKNETIILKVIKYGPISIIIILSLILSISLYINNQFVFNEEKNLIEKDYLERNKKLVQNQVNRIYNFIEKKHANTEIRLKESLKERVYEAHTIATNIYNENKHLDKKVVEKMIKDALRNIRFNNGRGYFFIYSFDYECILLPVAKRLEGTSFYNYKDGKGSYLIKNIVSQVKKEKEGFLTWWYHKPSDMKNQHKKIGFNKHFEPFDWFIGTGEYVEDFENDVKKEILEHIHNLKYAKNGYIFIINYDGVYLNHIRKEIIGLNALDAKDTDSYQTIVDTIKMVKEKGSGYKTYVQTKKPGTDLPTIKTSFVKGYEEFQWFIGKGFYEDDVGKTIEKQKELLEAKFKDNLQKVVIVSIILTILLSILSIKISNLLHTRFNNYQNEIKENLEKITQQHNILSHQSKMAALGEMIANIAHQWRQPLSMISTAATGMKLKKEMNMLEDSEFYENLDHINNSTQYLSKTIDDFRNFFSKNKERIEFSIKEPVDNSLNIVNAQFHNHDIEIINNIGESIVYGAKNELIQVFINILNNSRDELIKIENEKKIILIDSLEEKDYVNINFKDNAGGVSKEVIEHAFEPYFTTKHKSQGTGIGLYMSEEIISKHMDGEISISNCEFSIDGNVHYGAQVTIRLKLHK